MNLIRSVSASLRVLVFVDKVAVLNVEHVMAEIPSRSPLLREMIESGEVGLVGGIHHLDTGEVVFLGKGARP